MATVHRYQVVWDGFSGAPGYTSFHFRYETEPSATPEISTLLDQWCNSVRTSLPSVVTLTPSKVYQVLDEVTGELLNELTDGGTVSSHAGTNPGTFASSAGACIGLKTATVAGGRKVRGRIFVVPISAALFDTSGTLDSQVTTNLPNACSALISATTLAPWSVWKRPVAKAGGIAAPIYTTAVRDKVAMLTSRRD